jgi:hypothetical protein
MGADEGLRIERTRVESNRRKRGKKNNGRGGVL